MGDDHRLQTHCNNRTSVARNTTVSLRDIVPPRFWTTQETVYL